MITATIASIEQATPTVKIFRFSTPEPMEFKAGQWLDLYVDVAGNSEVGGYSMTSSPLTTDHVELAIKWSDANPVTRHLHAEASIGEVIDLVGGQGDVYYEEGMARSLVLVAGGIGITPLMSIVRYAREVTPDVPVTLLYSAPAADEHVFRPELEAMAAERPGLHLEFFVTRDGEVPANTLRGRIGEARIRSTMSDVDAMYFVCGPGAMIDEVTQTLSTLGVPKERVRFERWW